jgi:hypothetical protein
VKLLGLLLLIHTVVFGSNYPASAADVVQLVFTAWYSDRNDAALAHNLQKSRLRERLDPQVVFYFERLGVAPQSLQVLQRHRSESASRQDPPQPALSVEPKPTPEQARMMLQHLSAFTQGYVQGLPNFLCEEKTERYTNAVQNASGLSFARNLHHGDRLTWTLRFINGREDGNIVQFAKKQLMLVGGEAGQSASTGEFGGDLLVFFGPSRDTQIAWDHWEWVNRRRIAVFRYFNGENEPRFILSWHFTGLPVAEATVQAAIRGLVFFDSETGAVERLAFEAVNVPTAFPIQESRTIIDYGEIAVGDRSYVLPERASVFMESGQLRTLNEIVFRKYRKFEAESTVTFTKSRITYQTSSKK